MKCVRGILLNVKSTFKQILEQMNKEISEQVNEQASEESNKWTKK